MAYLKSFYINYLHLINKSNLTKLYYSIGEVANMFDVNTSLLRYWENQFPSIRPSKDRSGKRRYKKEDILKIDEVYNLVRVEGFTLEGAKKHLRSSGDDVKNLDQVISNMEKMIARLNGLSS